MTAKPEPVLDLDAIHPGWLTVCGPCDAGLPMACSCPDEDPRPVITDLVTEVKRLRAELSRMCEPPF